MLATLLRPQTIDDIIGQDHLLGPDKPLRAIIEKDIQSNIILYGNPGIGKTCIANIIASNAKASLGKFNATTLSIKDIRTFAKKDGRKILFIDEISRMSNTQSDVLLPFLENGEFTLIGATVANPFHAMSSPLISRCAVFQLEPLKLSHLIQLLSKGIKYLRNTIKDIKINQDAAIYIAKVSCGDGRKCLSLLELLSGIDHHITLERAKSISPNKYMVFDSKGDMHFDYASAYQGSIQASDPSSAIYWMAKWLESGEDPRYIARRMMVSASEDACGDPLAAMLAHSAYIAAQEIGRPESDIIFAHATVRIASSKRDKSAACSIWSALEDIRNNVEVWIPKTMKDCHYAGATKLGHGDYHDGMNQEAYVGVNKKYYKPEDWQ
jgi:putative ATPase